MEKRKLIMEKALELFAEKGFTATSVQEITERSDISKGAFYLSFKSKDELILALIHEYLQDFVADLDQLVSESDSDQVLYRFYRYHLDDLSAQSNFAKIFIQEQAHFLDEDFFAQISHYNGTIQQVMLTMLEEVYGSEIVEIKYDLVYTIQSLLRSYLELLLFEISLEPHLLARSLVEKTDLLAKQMSIPAITVDDYELLHTLGEDLLSKEKLLVAIDETIAMLSAPLVIDSLRLLRDEVIEPTFPNAVVSGLMKNIEEDKNCRRIHYLLHAYFDLLDNKR